MATGEEEWEPFPWNALFPELKELTLEGHASPLDRALLAMTCKCEHKERPRPYLDYISARAKACYMEAMGRTGRPILFHWFLRSVLDDNIRTLAFSPKQDPKNIIVLDEARAAILAVIENVAACGTVDNWNMLAGRFSSPSISLQLTDIMAALAAVVSGNNLPLLNHILRTYSDSLITLNPFLFLGIPSAEFCTHPDAITTSTDRSRNLLLPETIGCIIQWWLSLSSQERFKHWEARHHGCFWHYAVRSGRADFLTQVGAVLGGVRIPLNLGSHVSHEIGCHGSLPLLQAARLNGLRLDEKSITSAALFSGHIQFLASCNIQLRSYFFRPTGHPWNAGEVAAPWANLDPALLVDIQHAMLEGVEGQSAGILLVNALHIHKTPAEAEYWRKQLGVRPSATFCFRPWPVCPGEDLLAKLKWCHQHAHDWDTLYDSETKRKQLLSMMLHYLRRGDPELARWFNEQQFLPLTRGRLEHVELQGGSLRSDPETLFLKKS